MDTAQVDAITTALGNQFTLSPILLLPPMFVIAMVFFRWQALPALLLAALLGGVLAV